MQLRFTAIEDNWYNNNEIIDEINILPMVEWCENNCKKQLVQFGGRFYFTEEKDMNWFTLVWL